MPKHTTALKHFRERLNYLNIVQSRLKTNVYINAIIDFDSIVVKPTTMISQSKVEECPGSQKDNLKELMAIMKGELRSSLTKEIINYTKKRVPEEDKPE